MPSKQTIAVIANLEGFDNQALLSEMASSWRTAGLRVVGVLATDHDGDSYCSAGFLHDLASGKTFAMQLATAPADTSCHLDTAGLDQAAANLLDQIPQADLVILSKFGKQEAVQEGLWPIFQASLEAGKPLITTVSTKHIDAWKALIPGATWLDSSRESIEQWWQAIQA